VVQGWSLIEFIDFAYIWRYFERNAAPPYFLLAIGLHFVSIVHILYKQGTSMATNAAEGKE